MEIVHSDGKIYRVICLNSCKAAFAMRDKQGVDNFVAYIRATMQLKDWELMKIGCKYIASAVKYHGHFNRENAQVLEELSDFMEKVAYCPCEDCSKTLFELSKVVLNCTFEDFIDPPLTGFKEIWHSVRRLYLKYPQDISLLKELVNYEALLIKNEEELDFFWRFRPDITMAYHDLVVASGVRIESVSKLVNRHLFCGKNIICKCLDVYRWIEGMDRTIQMLFGEIAALNKVIGVSRATMPAVQYKTLQLKLDVFMRAVTHLQYYVSLAIDKTQCNDVVVKIIEIIERTILCFEKTDACHKEYYIACAFLALERCYCRLNDDSLECECREIWMNYGSGYTKNDFNQFSDHEFIRDGQ